MRGTTCSKADMATTVAYAVTWGPPKKWMQQQHFEFTQAKVIWASWLVHQEDRGLTGHRAQKGRATAMGFPEPWGHGDVSPLLRALQSCAFLWSYFCQSVSDLSTNLCPNRPHFHISHLVFIDKKAFSWGPKSSPSGMGNEISNLVLLWPLGQTEEDCMTLNFKCLRVLSVSLTPADPSLEAQTLSGKCMKLQSWAIRKNGLFLFWRHARAIWNLSNLKSSWTKY